MIVPYRILWVALVPLGLTGLAGCAGPSGSGSRSSPSLTTIALPERLEVVEPAPLPSLTPPPTTPDAPAIAVGPIPSPAPTTNRGLPYLLTGDRWPLTWSNVWVPVETWARVNGLSGLAQLAGGPEPVFSVGSPNGPVRIRIGNQTAHAKGHDSLLGYAPRLVGGVPYVHSLDLQKTLQPLLGSTFRFLSTNRVVVLDPGHGGRDSGTKNSFGLEYEKYFTLDWAWRLEALLAASGWKVILTRTNDVDIPLPDRVQIAERAHADLFLSLHFNSGAHNPDMSGIETYCLTPTGLPSTLRRDFEDDPREVLPNNAHDEENLLLASRLHRALLDVTGAADRGVRRARFMTVLRGQNRPAILIEGGFLSNAQESRRIATSAYRQSLAEAVARALNTPESPPVIDGASTAAAAPIQTPAGSSP